MPLNERIRQEEEEKKKQSGFTFSKWNNGTTVNNTAPAPSAPVSDNTYSTPGANNNNGLNIKKNDPFASWAVDASDTDVARRDANLNARFASLSDPSNPLTNPYISATNVHLQELSSLTGIDFTGGIGQDDITSWYKALTTDPTLKRTAGSATTPPGFSSPGTSLTKKKATTEERNRFNYERIAYLVGELYQNESNTQQAEEQLSNLQKEIKYWVGRTDLNLSDEQILKNIGLETDENGKKSLKNYKKLSEMENNRVNGAASSLNRSVNFTTDLLGGMIWAARNDSKDDPYSNAIFNALGVGKQWEANPDTIKYTDVTSKYYDPFMLSGTMHDMFMKYGVTSFDQKWLDDHKAEMFGTTDYTKIQNAVDYTNACIEEKKAVDSWIDYMIEDGRSYAEIEKELYSAHDFTDKNGNDISTLKATHLDDLDQSIRDGNLKDTTNKIGWNRAETLDRVRERIVERDTSNELKESFEEAFGVTKSYYTDPEGTVNPFATEALKNFRKVVFEYGTEEDRDLVKTLKDLDTPDEKNAFIEQFVTSGSISKEEAFYVSARVAEDYAADSYMPNKWQVNQYDSAVQSKADNLAVLHANGYEGEDTKAMQEKISNAQKAADTIGFMDETAQRLGYTGDLSDVSGVIAFLDGQQDYYQTDIDLIANEAGWQFFDDYKEYLLGSLDEIVKLQADEKYGANIISAINAVNHADENIEKYGKGLDEARATLDDIEQTINDLNDYGVGIFGEYTVDENGMTNEAGYKITWSIERADYTILLGDSMLQFNQPVQMDAPQRAAYFSMALSSQDEKTRTDAEEKRATTLKSINKDLESLASYEALLEAYGIKFKDAEGNNLDCYQNFLDYKKNLEDTQFYLQMTLIPSKDPDFLAIANEARRNPENDRSYYDPDKGYDPNGNYLDYVRLEYINGIYDKKYDNPYYLSKQEEDVYYYLLGTGRPEDAERYREFIDAQGGMGGIRNTAKSQQRAKELTDDYWYITYPSTFLTNLLSPVGAAYAIKQRLTGQEIDPNSPAFAPTIYTSTVRGEMGELVENATGNTGVARFTLDLVTSGVDSMINSQIWGPIFGKFTEGGKTAVTAALHKITGTLGSTLNMGAQAMSSAVWNAKINGADDDQAMVVGVATMAAETLSEAITFSNIFGAYKAGAVADETLSLGDNFFDALIRGLKDSTEEALGEMGNQFAEWFTDKQVMGINSEYARTVEEYMSKYGLTRDKAQALAYKDCAKDVFLAGLSGALMAPGTDVVAYSWGNFSTKIGQLMSGRSEYEYTTARLMNEYAALDENLASIEEAVKNAREKFNASNGKRGKGELAYQQSRLKNAKDQMAEWQGKHINTIDDLFRLTGLNLNAQNIAISKLSEQANAPIDQPFPSSDITEGPVETPAQSANEEGQAAVNLQSVVEEFIQKTQALNNAYKAGDQDAIANGPTAVREVREKVDAAIAAYTAATEARAEQNGGTPLPEDMQKLEWFDQLKQTAEAIENFIATGVIHEAQSPSRPASPDIIRGMPATEQAQADQQTSTFVPVEETRQPQEPIHPESPDIIRGMPMGTEQTAEEPVSTFVPVEQEDQADALLEAADKAENRLNNAKDELEQAESRLHERGLTGKEKADAEKAAGIARRKVRRAQENYNKAQKALEEGRLKQNPERPEANNIIRGMPSGEAQEEEGRLRQNPERPEDNNIIRGMPAGTEQAEEGRLVSNPERPEGRELPSTQMPMGEGQTTEVSVEDQISHLIEEAENLERDAEKAERDGNHLVAENFRTVAAEIRNRADELGSQTTGELVSTLVPTAEETAGEEQAPTFDLQEGLSNLISGFEQTAGDLFGQIQDVLATMAEQQQARDRQQAEIDLRQNVMDAYKAVLDGLQDARNRYNEWKQAQAEAADRKNKNDQAIAELAEKARDAFSSIYDRIWNDLLPKFKNAQRYLANYLTPRNNETTAEETTQNTGETTETTNEGDTVASEATTPTETTTPVVAPTPADPAAMSIVALSKAQQMDPTTQLAVVTGVLTNRQTTEGVADSEAGLYAGAAANKMLKTFGSTKTLTGMKHAIANAYAHKLDMTTFRSAMTTLALSGNNGLNTLRSLFNGQMDIMQAVGTINANPETRAAVDNAVTKYAEALERRRLAAANPSEAVTGAETNLENAEAVLDAARTALEEKRLDRDHRNSELQDAMSEFDRAMDLPSQTEEQVKAKRAALESASRAVDTATEKLGNAISVVREYEERHNNASRARDTAKQAYDNARQAAYQQYSAQAAQNVAAARAQNAQSIADQLTARNAAAQQATAEAENNARAVLEEKENRRGRSNANRTTAERIADRFPDATPEERERIIRMVQEKLDQRDADKVADRKRFIQNLKRKFGIDIDILDTTKGGTQKRVNGYYDRVHNRIVLDEATTTSDLLLLTGLHEVTHSIEGTEYYDRFADLVLGLKYGSDWQNSSRYKADIQGKISQYNSWFAAEKAAGHDPGSGNLDEIGARKELVADATGRILFTDANGQVDMNLLNTLVANEPSIAKKIFSAIGNFLKKLGRIDDPSVYRMEQARKLLAKALQDQNSGDGEQIQYAIGSDDWHALVYGKKEYQQQEPVYGKYRDIITYAEFNELESRYNAIEWNGISEEKRKNGGYIIPLRKIVVYTDADGRPEHVLQITTDDTKLNNDIVQDATYLEQEGYDVEFQQGVLQSMYGETSSHFRKSGELQKANRKNGRGANQNEGTVRPRDRSDISVQGRRGTGGGSEVSEDQRSYSLPETDLVEPTSDEWQTGPTTAEVKRMYPGLYDVAADENETRNPTQVVKTRSTYERVFNMLKDEGFTGRTLDASSGLGLGTQAGREMGFDVTDIEPYADKARYMQTKTNGKYTEAEGAHNPDYTDYSVLIDAVESGDVEPYDFIISNAVLNVVPQDQRDALVSAMDRLLAPGGRMYINVRTPGDVRTAKTKQPVNEANCEYYMPDKGSYQKGFSMKELVAYLNDALEGRYTIEEAPKWPGTSVFITKNNDGTQYSLPSDEDYEIAVASGDMKAALEMVERAANAAGYTESWSHGSNNASFTKFNIKENATGAKGIFLAADPTVANFYSMGTTGSPVNTRLVGKPVTTIEDALSEIERIEGPDIAERLKKRYSDKEIIEEANSLRDFKKGGLYHLMVNPGKKLVVDAKGARWNNIRSEYGIRTDYIAEWARTHGYDSCQINNVIDGGAYPTDVLVVFDENRVKSAELVVYDDAGEMIPLSQRFNDQSDDIRYSLPSDDILNDLIDRYIDEELANIDNDDYNPEPIRAERAEPVIRADRTKPAPQPSGTDSGPVQSGDTIMQNWAKALGIPADTRRRKYERSLRRTTKGYMRQGSGIIHVQDAGNVATAAHEMGHVFDEMFDLRSHADTQAMIDKMSQDPRWAAWLNGYTEAERPGEAIAEVMKNWIIDRNKAINIAGQDFIDYLEKRLDERGWLKPTLEAAEQLNKNRLADSATLAEASVKLEDPKRKTWLKAWQEKGWRAVGANVYDYTLDIDHLSQVYKESGKFSDAFDPRTLLLAREGKIKEFTDSILGTGDGKGTLIDAEGNIVKKADGTPWGSLQDILSKIGEEDEQSFNAYLLLMHARDRQHSDIKLLSEMTQEEIAALSEEEREQLRQEEAQIKKVFSDEVDVESGITIMEQKHPGFKDVAQELYDFYDAFMRTWLVNTGMLPAAEYEAMHKRFPHYVPTFRTGMDANRQTGARPGQTGTNGVRRLENGGTTNLYNPVMGMVEYIQRYIASYEQNEILRSLDSMFSDPDINTRGIAEVAQDDITLDYQGATVANAVKNLQDYIDGLQQNGIALPDTLIEGLLKAVAETDPKVWIHKNPNDNDVITVRLADGTYRSWTVYDTSIVRALTFMPSTSAMSRATSIFRGLNSFLCSMATSKSLSFGLFNFMSDSGEALATGHSAYTWVDYMGHLFKSFWDLGKNKFADFTGNEVDETYRLFKLFGQMGSRYAFRAKDTQKETRRNLYNNSSTTGEKLADILYGGKNTTVGEKLKNLMTAPVRAIASVNDFLEDLTRYNEFRVASENGLADLSTYEGRLRAGRLGREVTVDFSKRGYNETITAARTFVPFLNASIQGTAKALTLFTKENEGNRIKIAARIVVNTMLVNAVATFLRGMTWDDDDKEAYDQLSDYEQNKYFHIKVGDEFIRIKRSQNPLIQLGAAFGNLIGSTMTGFEDNPLGDFAGVCREIANNMLIDPTQNVLSPFIDAANNRTYWGGQIENSTMQEMDVANRYNPDDKGNVLYRMIGAVLGVSPAKVDYVIGQYTGSLGVVGSRWLSAAIGNAQEGERADEVILGSLVDSVRDRLAERFSIDPVETNRINSTYKDMLGMLEGISNAADEGMTPAQLRGNLTEKEKRNAISTAKEMMKTGGKVGRIKKEISTLWKKYFAAKENKNYTDERKEQEMRDIRKQLNEKMLKANEIIGDYFTEYGHVSPIQYRWNNIVNAAMGKD